MWNLLMGGTYSSSEGEEEEKAVEEVRPSAKRSSELATLHTNEKKMEVHRIPSPTRESGDGSENISVHKVDKKATSEVGEKLNEITPTAVSPSSDDPQPTIRWIKLPKTNIVLKKLPPIKDDGLKLLPTEPTSPLVQLPSSVPQRLVKRNSDDKIMKEKQPKFVPYEPYKAAITPLVQSKTSRKRLSSTAVKSEDGDCSSVSASGPATPRLSESGPETSKSSSRPFLTLNNSTYSLNDTGSSQIEPQRSTSEEIEKLKAQLDEKDKQLRIQTQINSEVKRLLVASVGEDIEAKVDFLTQDKARLSADIRNYASKISRDFEEKEQLSVESTLWKSKFLACSVIVDELARWKVTLIHRNDEYEHNLRLLFHEHSVLWATLMETYTILARLRSAFDPLAASLAPAEAASILGLADHTLKVAKQLRTRLMGETKLKTANEASRLNSVVPSMIDTPAEEGLKKTMGKSFTNESSEYSELASLAVTGAAMPHLKKLGDQLTSPSGFKNCTHCHGVVQNI